MGQGEGDLAGRRVSPLGGGPWGLQWRRPPQGPPCLSLLPPIPPTTPFPLVVLWSTDGGCSVLPARNCMRLQVLELDHVAEINQEVAAEVCREGLKGLEMLVLTSTPVTPKALLHFNSE